MAVRAKDEEGAGFFNVLIWAIHGKEWESMILVHSGLVLPLVFLALCNVGPGRKSLAGEPMEMLASPEGRNRAERSPTESLKPSGGGEEIRVLWRVSGFVSGPGASMDRAEAEAMLAKSLDIRGDRIVFDGKACEGIRFSRTKEKLSAYLGRVYNVAPKDLELTDQLIELIRTDCSLPGFQEYMRLGDRRLVIQVRGVFFFFQPKVTY
ncbi:MAG TPA: hypothetical protein PK250_02620 [Syntrophobacter fumaroxidans]|nr:hypothetical protein [Syntrophobacter fumaroxidans]